MEKSKIKSILPKPSPSHPQQTPSPKLSGSATPLSGKRRSVASGLADSKKRRSLPTNISSNMSSVPAIVPIAPAPVSISMAEDDSSEKSKQTGHRPVTSCTFCRQHKIKCNASENYPNPCQRCERMGLKCEIDPQFRPKKGSQIQSLKSDVDELRAKIEILTKNESLLTQALNQHNILQQQQQQQQQQSYTPRAQSTHSTNSPVNFQSPQLYPAGTYQSSPNSISLPSGHLNDSVNSSTNPNQLAHVIQEGSDTSPSTNNTPNSQHLNREEVQYVSEFILGEVHLPLDKANDLHHIFMTKHLPFLPIITSRSATELYHKSQLLFWTVILTASLSEPDPTLYMSLASLIKQLAIETCWIRTPRSTHVIQALIILSIWPLPNEKVLDDCSYRFIGLAKNLSLQLGLHRGGEFIQEFSRTQVSLGPDAERWRTRSWIAVFFCEQFWSSVLGLPPSINTTDYLLENARVDQTLPKDFRCLISLSIFQCKLVNVMGISVTRPDGLLEPSNRAGSLNILDRELERLKFKLNIVDGSAIEIYYLYVKLMICCFAFLPGTPIEDQVKYVSSAYLSATRVVTVSSQMLKDNISLIELPIYVRQAMTYSVLLLFKLHLSRYLIDKYVDSSRQSIVTVHRLLRNTLSSWKDLKNDISRTAKVLENLNIVLYTYPDILLNDNLEAGGSIINRMRSHLTASLFYDLVWCVHEGRRRTMIDKSKKSESLEDTKIPPNSTTSTSVSKRPAPLPFYNQITKDDFKTITTTTPNGTTITTLVPTDQAMNQARNASGNKPLEINGIPLAMLEATGSIKDTIRESQTPAPEVDNPTTNAPILPSTVKIKSEYDNVVSTPQQPLLAHQSQALQHQSFAMLGHQPVDTTPNQPMFINSDSMQIQQPSLVDPASAQATPIQYIGAPINGVADQMDNFFQQQSNGWLNNDNYQDDDFLGWFDVNMRSDQ